MYLERRSIKYLFAIFLYICDIVYQVIIKLKAEVVHNYDFSGFTLLRRSSIVNLDGTPTSEMKPFVENLVKEPEREK